MRTRAQKSRTPARYPTAVHGSSELDTFKVALTHWAGTSGLTVHDLDSAATSQPSTQLTSGCDVGPVDRSYLLHKYLPMGVVLAATRARFGSREDFPTLQHSYHVRTCHFRKWTSKLNQPRRRSVLSAHPHNGSLARCQNWCSPTNNSFPARSVSTPITWYMPWFL